MPSMGSRAGAPLLATFLATSLLASACGHLTKYKVEEVPISSFAATGPSPTVSAEPAVVPPIIDMGSGPATPPPPAVSGAVAASPPAGPAPQPVAGGDDVVGDPSDPKIQAASKLLKTGKRNDLMMARKLLAASVFAGTGTADQARLLRLVCSKLGDKGCVGRCGIYIK
jgi:hypothetical protein